MLRLKLDESQKEDIFFSVLDGMSQNELATKFNVSKPAIHNAFWKTHARLMYLEGNITYQIYHENCCCVNSVKALSDLYDVRQNKNYLKMCFERQKNHKVEESSLLMHLNIRPSVLKTYLDHGISTIRCYKEMRKSIRKLHNIGHESVKTIDKRLETLCLNN